MFESDDILVGPPALLTAGLANVLESGRRAAPTPKLQPGGGGRPAPQPSIGSTAVISMPKPERPT